MSAQDIVIVKGARNEPGSDFGKTCCCRATFARGIPAVQGGGLHGRHQQSSQRRGAASTGICCRKVRSRSSFGGDMVMSDKLVLWGVGTMRTFRAHWALHELGLPYESRPILPRSGETKTPEYTALNARQKIPLLVDGDFRIGESAAIVAYLSQNYSTPEHALIPEEKL